MLFFILGAPDPEMAQIESLLRLCKVPYGYALSDTGKRVHPENAYRATGVSASKDPFATSVWVECCPEDERIRRQDIIDHHFPGDPGFGRHPSQFMPASSLGQTISLLASNGLLPSEWRSFSAPRIPAAKKTWHYLIRKALRTNWIFHAQAWYCLANDGYFYCPPAPLVLAAAADHCLGHAYMSQCPGVSPLDLRRWRAETRARRQRVSVEQIHADVEVATQTLLQLPKSCIEGFEFRVADSKIKELPEASAILGEPVMYSYQDFLSGRQKVSIRNGGFQQIRSWMNWANRHMTDVYGDPARGFAGGYLS